MRTAERHAAASAGAAAIIAAVQHTSFDVTVVGAGVAGLATALGAAQLGLRTALVGPRAPVQRPDDASPFDVRIYAVAPSSVALLERLNLVLCAGQMSAATRARLAAALQEMPVTTASDAPQRQGRVAQAVLMMMLCPAYLVQK